MPDNIEMKAVGKPRSDVDALVGKSFNPLIKPHY